MKNSKRANGDGSIYYEKSRERWVCAIVDPTGKRIVKRFKTEQEAKSYLTVMKSSIITNVYIQPNQITFGQWLIDYITLYVKPNAQPSTVITYANYCEYAEPLSEIPIQKLTANHLQKLINDLPNNLSSTTKNGIASMFKRALKKAYNTKVITFNPMNDVNIPKKNTPDVDVFSTDEIKAILSYLEKSGNDRNYAIFKTAFVTGMRLGEILALKNDDIKPNHIVVSKTVKLDLNKKRIIGLTKGKATRLINVPASIIKMLKQQKPNDEGFIFYSRINNNVLTENNIHKAWETILRKTGIKYRKIHAIRHTHATQLLENGVSITEVSKRLGHASVTITLNTYSHVLNDANRQNELNDKITTIFSL